MGGGLAPTAIVSIHFPRPNGVFRGFGHVTFCTADLAAQAAAMPPPRVAGRSLTVSHSTQSDAGGYLRVGGGWGLVLDIGDVLKSCPRPFYSGSRSLQQLTTHSLGESHRAGFCQ